MFFLLSRACNRFLKNIRLYCLIILELAIGLTFIACQENVVFSIEKRLRDIETQYSGQGISVNAYVKEYTPGLKELPIDMDDIKHLCKLYGDYADISYISYGNLVYHYIESIPIFGMSEYAFRKIFKEDPQGQPFIGSHALEILKKQPIQPENTQFLFDALGIKTDKNDQTDSKDYGWQEFNEEQNLIKLISFVNVAESDFSIAECIVLPLDIQELLKGTEIFYNSNCEFIFHEGVYSEPQSLMATESDILNYLSEKHENFNYKISNKIEDYLKNSKDLSSSLTILSWIARYSLLIITVGMIGLLLIILDRRKRDMAMSLIVGAVKWKLAAELITELLLLCGSGCVIAAIASFVITPGLGTSQYQAVVTGQSLLDISAVSLLIAVISCLLSMINVRIKNPVETLREG